MAGPWTKWLSSLTAEYKPVPHTFEQEPKSFDEIKEILSRCQFKDRTFHVFEKNGIFFVQLRYMDTCIDTGKEVPQHGRKWQISPFMTKSEIVQTAFKAVITSQEHVAREFFMYKGERVYGPHYDVEKLVELCKTREHVEYRA